MTATECPREQEIVDAIRTGRWAAGREPELREHAAACGVCSDVALVAERILEERDQAWREAQVPAAAQVWWRITIRARAEAARTAARPITVAQGIGGAIAAGLCATLIGVAWPPVGRWLAWFVGAASQEGKAQVLALASVTLQQALWSMLPILIPIGLCIVLAPIALYLVLSDE